MSVVNGAQLASEIALHCPTRKKQHSFVFIYSKISICLSWIYRFPASIVHFQDSRRKRVFAVFSAFNNSLSERCLLGCYAVRLL
jgi:hypothetical protein